MHGFQEEAIQCRNGKRMFGAEIGVRQDKRQDNRIGVVEHQLVSHQN